MIDTTENLVWISNKCPHSIKEKKEAIERANEKDLNRFKTIFESEIRTPELIQKELDLFYSLFYEKDINNVPPFVSILNVNHFNQFSIEDIKRIRYAFNEKNRGAIYKDYCLICKPDPLHQTPYLLKYELYYEFLKNQSINVIDNEQKNELQIERPHFFNEEQFKIFQILREKYHTSQNQCLAKYRYIYQYLKSQCGFNSENKALFQNYIIEEKYCINFTIITDRDMSKEIKTIQNLIKENLNT